MVKAGISEAELHCVVGNMRARRFYRREGWLSKGQITEHVMGSNGKIDALLVHDEDCRPFPIEVRPLQLAASFICAPFRDVACWHLTGSVTACHDGSPRVKRAFRSW